jgi:hypothetical protein
MYKKYYLSRAQTKAMSAEYPIGDPFGGPAYGEKNDPVSAGIMAVASLGGAYLSSQAAQSAAGQYANAANQGINYSQQMFNTINPYTMPYRGIGAQATNALGSFLPGQYSTYDASGNVTGTATGNGYLTANPTMTDLATMMPNYEFGLKTGLGQVNAAQNASGGYLSGNQIAGAQQFAQGYAGNALQNAFTNYQTNRQNVAANLYNLAGLGTSGAQISSNAGTGTASNVSNMLSNIGQANAAATMGSANAYAGGLNNISNYAMLYGLKNMQTPVAT